MELTRIDPFIHYFDRIRSRTLDVFDDVPADRLEWRPGPEDLVQKTQTPAGATITVWKWLRTMVEHEAITVGRSTSFSGRSGSEGLPCTG